MCSCFALSTPSAFPFEGVKATGKEKIEYLMVSFYCLIIKNRSLWHLKASEMAAV
jgi:hypothetical protein